MTLPVEDKNALLRAVDQPGDFGEHFQISQMPLGYQICADKGAIVAHSGQIHIGGVVRAHRLFAIKQQPTPSSSWGLWYAGGRSAILAVLKWRPVSLQNR